jgi:hypothetical protein
VSQIAKAVVLVDAVLVDGARVWPVAARAARRTIPATSPAAAPRGAVIWPALGSRLQ